jgi:hypothetical protein
MKKKNRIMILCALLLWATALSAQRTPVDDLFDKYSERDGFTVVSISGKMFSMFSDKDKQTDNSEKVVSNLKSIMILSVEDSTLNESINFYKELESKMNFKVYEELMVVKEGKNITKFLTIQKGDIIKELLVITGGPSGNSIISIKGDLNLKALSELSETTGIQELEKLDGVDKKQ